MTRVQLRPAVLKDARMVFKWRNDPFIVARGSSQRTVRWKEHLKWFKETISGGSRMMFIIQKDAQPIGQVRFDRLNEEVCVISIYLIQRFTGKGYGVEAIRHSCSKVFERWTVRQIIACVRLDNPRARSAFMKAGFIERNSAGFCPKAHFTLSLSR